MGGPGLDLKFTGEVWHWRGPAPFHFVTVPDDEGAQLSEVAPAVTYGWGMVPVRARIGTTEWRTGVWPKGGGHPGAGGGGPLRPGAGAQCARGRAPAGGGGASARAPPPPAPCPAPRGGPPPRPA